jgi:hypothetical protein
LWHLLVPNAGAPNLDEEKTVSNSIFVPFLGPTETGACKVIGMEKHISIEIETIGFARE